MPSTHPNRCRAARFALTLAPLVLLLPAALAAQARTSEAFVPDVTVIYLGSVSNWGTSGGVRAYSVGTTSCNVGSSPVAWCDSAV